MDNTLFIDGADDAIVGLAYRCGQPPLVIYSEAKLLKHFMDQGMDLDEAEEWISFNIKGAWMGAGTPAVMYRATARDVRKALS